MIELAGRICLTEGDRADLGAMAPFHYHAGPPATCVRVLRATDSITGEIAGVLAVSMPVLNARWRDLVSSVGNQIADSPRYRTHDRAADARRLNAEVRTISRVIVDPRYRRLGIATSLVRRYLAEALTPVTEAVAVMGTVTEFFSAAGMTAYTLPPSARDLRLADALGNLGIEAWMLADPGLIPARSRRSALLERELRRWANGSRGTRRLAQGDLGDLMRRAAGICRAPMAYVHVAWGRGGAV